MTATRARLARQPGLGLAGMVLVLPVAVALGAGLGGFEPSLLVLGPLSTYALPVIAMVAFWWDDWPGTRLRPPLRGVADTLLVVCGGVVLTVAAQAAVAHVDLRGVFDPGASTAHAPTFPATMTPAAAIFTAMLQLTLVSEGAPLKGLAPIPAGGVAFAVSCAAGAGVYELAVGTGLLSSAELGAVLVCVAMVQVGFYVVLRGWPFRLIGSRAGRLATANAVVLATGCGAYLAMAPLAGLRPAAVAAVAGCVVAAGLVVGMLLDGWPDSLLPPARGRAAKVAAVALLSALLYAGLESLAQSAAWSRAEPQEWTAYVALNAIGVGIILHVAIGGRWPFTPGAPASATTG
jgi:hypothetical protein